ncbi:hypothetical protein EDC04DRAFT_2597807 [Pisolithus marmoratus]|nr:hypothetical protein EDC04DRAFT_2597807 [Pisolithus marmoratus]
MPKGCVRAVRVKKSVGSRVVLAGRERDGLSWSWKSRDKLLPTGNYQNDNDSLSRLQEGNRRRFHSSPGWTFWYRGSSGSGVGSNGAIIVVIDMAMTIAYVLPAHI